MSILLDTVTLSIPALGKRRHAALSKFEAAVVYRVSSRPVWVAL